MVQFSPRQKQTNRDVDHWLQNDESEIYFYDSYIYIAWFLNKEANIILLLFISKENSLKCSFNHDQSRFRISLVFCIQLWQ
jgi:hypothetical protein